MMNKAWIACSLAAAALTGCQSDTEPVSQVPPPNYAAEPEPLPPVSINAGSPSVGDPDFKKPSTGPVTGPGAYEPEPLPPQPASRTYTIRKGDTFWSIAQREYGDGQKWRDISAANPSADPKKLAVGQQITLP
ncbi:MAG: LysM peptidoglycan-binding domain-containing protein [Planctomycetota bacterium]